MDLTRLSISRDLILRNLSLKGLVANSMQVNGTAQFALVTVTQALTGGIDLKLGHLTRIQIDGLTWDKDTRPFDLDGLVYQSLAVKDNDRSRLMDIVHSSLYNPQAYVAMENYLRQQGYPDDADTLFTEQKDRERGEGGLGFIGSIWSLFLKFFVDYGREPQLAFVWAGLIVAIGTIVFHNPDGMELPDVEDPTKYQYSPFWYSLNLFFAVIDLQFGRHWEPKTHRRFARIWVHVQTLLGWLLIPIAIATVSGLIK